MLKEYFTNMTVRFLGTGSSLGIPVIGCSCDTCTSVDPRDGRMRTSLLIENGDENFVIDAGPDFRQQMLISKTVKLTGILLTHEHKDHIAGLDDVRAFNYLQSKAVDIYAEERVLDIIRTREFYYAFAPSKKYSLPQMNLIPITNKEFKINNTKIQPIRGLHLDLPILGFRIDKFAYITDMSMLPEAEQYKLKNLEVLVINALQKTKHLSHFNLEEALEIILKLKPKVAYLTHISHKMGSYRELLRSLPENILPAYDNLSFDV